MNEKDLRIKIYNTITQILSEGVEANFLPIETPYGSSDYKLFEKIVNQGIDSNLNRFVKSKFEKSKNFDNKFLFNFNKEEIPILLQRLENEGSDEAFSWKEDIEQAMIEPSLDEERISQDGSALDILGQFNMPDDLDFIPARRDIKDIESTV